MSSYDAGTPLGGERPLRRRLYSPDGILASSPFQEMDGDVDATIPDTPVDAGVNPVLLEGISKLFKAEFEPIKVSTRNLERRMAELNISVDDRFQTMSSQMEKNDARVNKLEETIQGPATPRSDDSWVTQLTTLKD